MAGPNAVAQSAVAKTPSFSTHSGSTTVLAESSKDTTAILVEEALRNNPGLKAQMDRVRAAEKRPSQADVLPDPTADIQFMMLPINGGLNASDALTKGVSIGVTQHLPYPGKLKLRKQKAEREADAARIQLIAMESSLKGKVESASYQYALYVHLLGINDKIQDALKAAAKGASAIYASGKGNQADVLIAQTALTKSKTDRITLENQLEIARARLDDLVGSTVPSDLLSRITIPEPESLPIFDTLIKDLRNTAPMVLSAQSEVAVREKQIDIAKKNFKPDFFVGGRYRHNDVTMGGHDYFAAMVGITLPFFHHKKRYTPALQEANYMRESAREKAGSVLNEARFMLTDAYQTGSHDLDIYSLYKDGLLIQANKAFQSALTSYTVGESDFMTLLRALTNYYNYQSQALMSKVDYHVSVARMEAVLGRPLRTISAVRPQGGTHKKRTDTVPDSAQELGHREDKHK